ncbi:MAG: type III-B CRISPR module RAMP protein Cmr6 [Thermoproteus sp.]
MVSAKGGRRQCLAPGYNAYSCIVLDMLEAPPEEFAKYSREVVVDLMNAYRADVGALSAYLAYLQGILSSLPLSLKIELEVTTPLLVHVRNPYMPLEIGLAWHPIFNAPYIPATTIKGALRAAASGEVCGRKAADLFGEKDEAGALIVTDALPITESVLGADVITPHYKEPNAVEEHKVKPTPIVFPVVKPGARFAFFIASEDGGLAGCVGGLLKLVDAALQKGLGAKTRVGYGRSKKL